MLMAHCCTACWALGSGWPLTMGTEAPTDIMAFIFASRFAPSRAARSSFLSRDVPTKNTEPASTGGLSTHAPQLDVTRLFGVWVTLNAKYTGFGNSIACAHCLELLS